MYYWIITVMLIGTAPQNFDESVNQTLFGPMETEVECETYRLERTHSFGQRVFDKLYDERASGYRVTEVSSECVYREEI